MVNLRRGNRVEPISFFLLMRELILIGFLLYFLTRSQLEKISHEVMRTYVREWGFDGVTIFTDIAISNNSIAPIGIDGFEGSVIYQGQEVAKVGLINKVDIPSKSDSLITVGAKILYGPATAVIIDSIRTGRVENQLRLKGVIYAGQIKIPVNTNHQLW